MSDAVPDIILGEFRINNRESVRVSLGAFKGVRLLDIRKWFLSSDGKTLPGRGGISVNVKHLSILVGLVNEAFARARADGLLDDGGGS